MGKIFLEVELSFEGELTPERQKEFESGLDLVLVDEVAALILADDGLEFVGVQPIVQLPAALRGTEHSLYVRQTCGACPEQYDVFSDDIIVGYLRLRHGLFTAREGGVAGDVVYSANTEGDGSFEDDEREFHLERALEEIAKTL